MKEGNILVFGDSISWGANDTTQGGWVGMLNSFVSEKTNFETLVYNLGVSGDDSNDLLKRFVPECEARKPNVIIIAIGGNDSSYINEESNLNTPPEKFKENIQMLIELAKGFTENVIFVGILPSDESKTTPIPWDPSIYYTNKLATQNNQIIKELCAENNIPFIDLFEEWTKLDYKPLLDDGCHPTTEGHRKIFETVKNFLLERKLI